ncbi:MAG: calcium-binding protein, partial [Desulfovibrio desulfuricans]|nr:calcium-binding protein [Desulfovibrio desulfuricans]
YNVPVDSTGKGTLTLDNTNTEDVYLDASTVTATVTGVTGGNYENVVTGQTATANIADTIDPIPVTITGVNTEEAATQVEFDIDFGDKLSHLPHDGAATIKVNVGGTVVGTTADGKEIIEGGTDYAIALKPDGTAAITEGPAGSNVIVQNGLIKLFATNTFNTNVEADGTTDFYNDSSVLTARITSVDGGKFEAFAIGKAADATIGDTIDTTMANLHVDSINGSEVTFTIKLDHEPDPAHPGEVNAFVDVYGGGETPIPITKDASGNWTGTFTVDAEDADKLTAMVTRIEGGNFENTKGGTIAVNLAGGASTLTVDESCLLKGNYEIGDGVKEATTGLDTFFGQNVDEETAATYALHVDSTETGLKAVVDGKLCVVRFVEGKDDDGNIVKIFGRAYEELTDKDGNVIRSTEGPDIFTVEIDSVNNKLSVALTEEGTIYHDEPGVRMSEKYRTAVLGETTGHDESAGLDEEAVPLTGISVVKTVTGNAGSSVTTVTKALNLSFEDDAPTLTSGGSDLDISYYKNAGSPENLMDCGPALDFTHGAPNYTTANGKVTLKEGGIDLQYWKAAGITLGTGRITKSDVEGKYDLTIDNPETSTAHVVYSSKNTNSSSPVEDHGLAIVDTAKTDKDDHRSEISYRGGEGQALVIDLGGKVAYGADIELGAFYTGNPEVDKSPTKDDKEPETALVIFRRNGVEVASFEIKGNNPDGTWYPKDGMAVEDGFDQIIIAADDNGSKNNNDFVVRSVHFNTLPSDAPLAVIKGRVEYNAGADGFLDPDHTVEFNAEVAEKGFMAIMDGFKKPVPVTVEVSPSGMFIKATYDANPDENITDTRTLFAGILNNDGSWTLNQYAEFKVEAQDGRGVSTYNLPIQTATDFDGDYAVTMVSIPTVIPEEERSAVNDVMFKVTIQDGSGENDHILGYDESEGYTTAGVEVQVDKDQLYEGATVTLVEQFGASEGGDKVTHTLTWNGSTFVTAEENFSFTYDESGTISWKTAIPSLGTLLNISASQTMLDGEYSVSASDYTQLEIPNVLGSQGSLVMRELGCHSNGNYFWNPHFQLNGKDIVNVDNATPDEPKGWEISFDAVQKSGSFAREGLTPDVLRNIGVEFKLTYNKPAEFSETRDGDWVTLANTDALVMQGVNIPDGMFTLKYNVHTGEYTVRLDNSIPITEKSDNWKYSTNVKFGIETSAGDVVLGSKDFTFSIKGSNDAPTLNLVGANGEAETSIIPGTVGRVLSSESSAYRSEVDDTDQVDYGTTTYYVFKQGVTNDRGFSNKGEILTQDKWLTVDGTKNGEKIFNGDQLVYNEKNFDAWMDAYKSHVKESGMDNTTFGSDDEKKISFLSTPATGKYSSSVDGKFGTLTIDEKTGNYTYTPKDFEKIGGDVRSAGGVVQETFSLLVVDHKGAFDIKDVTFLAVLDTDNVVHYFNGSPEMFSDGFDISNFVKDNMGVDAPAHAFAYAEGAADDDALGGTDANDALLGGAGNDSLDGGASNDILIGDSGADVLGGGKGNDLLFGGSGEDTLTGGDGNDVLTGGDGNDILYGDEALAPDNAEGNTAGGDDLLFGGAGDDLLFGGAGSDYLDGGAGADKLYGGAGNDVIAFDGDDAVINGGSGVDFLVGEGSVEALLQGHDGMDITDVEVAIDTAMSLTSMDDIAEKLGVTVENGKVSVGSDAGWTQGSKQQAANGDEFVTFTHTDAETGAEDATLTVAKAVLENSNG